ncbi:MAG: cell division protein FtsZ [Merdibacter sp.]
MNEFNQVANIKVFGIGGGGSNAVNRMVADGVKGVTFYIANTDVQVMKNSDCENKIVLGRETTKGLGAGGNPEVGRKAAEETENEIREALKGDMVFPDGRSGRRNRTGAAPLFAKVAKEEGALTIGIVTKPFTFEEESVSAMPCPA